MKIGWDPNRLPTQPPGVTGSLRSRGATATPTFKVLTVELTHLGLDSGYRASDRRRWTPDGLGGRRAQEVPVVSMDVLGLTVGFIGCYYYYRSGGMVLLWAGCRDNRWDPLIQVKGAD